MTISFSALSESLARALVVVTLAGVVGIGTPAPAAEAGVVHQLGGSFDGAATPAGALGNPNGVAIDHVSGDVYVADIANNVVDKFDASGTYLSQITGTVTPAGFFAFANPAAVAVDNSGGVDASHVYVVDQGNDVVDEFDSTGAYVSQLTGTPSGPFAGVSGVDVDGSGNVWVYESSNSVDEFDSSGVFVTQFSTGAGTDPGFAVDSIDRTYAVNSVHRPVQYDSPTAAVPGARLGRLDLGPTNSLAVDRSNDTVYVDDGSHIALYDASRTLKETFGSSELTDSGQGGVGVDASGDAYVANPSDGKVYIYQALTINSPTVTIDAPSNVTSSHATFTGTVNPQGTNALNDTTWHFEYSTDGGSTWTSTAGGDVGTGTSDVPVSDEVNTLLPNDDVQVRLVATNVGGTTTSSVQSFTTPPIAPTAATLSAQDLSTTHLALEGLVNAEHSPTTYYFELGTTTAYGLDVPATHDGDAGSSARTVAVIQQVHGLQPNATYHYRVVAHNAAGTATGQDQTFTTTGPLPSPACVNAQFRTGASSSLIDCRALELVSPPDKNGGDVMTDSQRTRAAADGSAVGFVSREAFADAQGTGIASDYVSARSDDPHPGTNGWSTHGITPPQQPIPMQFLINGLDPLYVSDFSPDLSTGVFLSWKPLADEPSLANEMSLYLRRDLRTPGSGTYALVSACPLCDATSTPLPSVVIPAQDKPYVAGASADFHHILFESYFNLTSDATGSADKLYESADGVVRLAGILPDGTAAPTSIAGQGAGYGYTQLTPHTISADGTRVFFAVPQGTCDAFVCGELYLRTGGSSTVKLNASERSLPDPGPDPRSPLPATYWDASVDGSRVLFTTTEALTDDAPVDNTEKLYLYDASKPDTDPHNLTFLSVDREPADGQSSVVGVIGASADGHYVYLVANGQLVSGGPVSGLGDGVYLWHDGEINFVGRLQPGSENENLNASWTLTAKQAQVTPDGKHLLFSSGARTGPTGYDQGTCNDENVGPGCRELYVYSAESHQLRCVSCNPTGAPATADASDAILLDTNGPQTASHVARALTDDGKRVFFTTPEALVPQDVNGQSDVYEYDVPSGTVHLLSDGQASAGAYFMETTPSGDDAFFVTRQALVGWDRDTNYDMYDARVNGGFPDPSPVAACSGDGCLGAPAGAPAGLSPGSELFAGPGNAKSAPKAKPRHCRRGLVRKRVRGKVRCVKPRHRRHRAQARHAAAQRRVK
jgi:hypothetical protein